MLIIALVCPARAFSRRNETTAFGGPGSFAFQARRIAKGYRRFSLGVSMRIIRIAP
jgi:hypothetical protein